MKRRALQTSGVVRIGIPGIDVAAMSTRIYGTLLDGPLLVRLDHKARVYSSDPDTVHSVLGESIAGVYTIGHPLADIQGDIDALVGDCRNGMLA